MPSAKKVHQQLNILKKLLDRCSLSTIRKGKLYIIGGTSILLGLLMPIVERLIYITFDLSKFIGWCIYPALVLVILGGMCIFLAINHRARESMEKKFFI